MSRKSWTSLMIGVPPATLGFAHGALDRGAHIRGHATQLAAMSVRPDARTYLFCGESVVLKRNDDLIDPLFELASLPNPDRQLERLFLGLENGAPRFATLLDPQIHPNLEGEAALQLSGVRQLALDRAVSPEHLGAIASGKAMAFWHTRHRFCSNCGAPTELSQGGWRRDCAACDAQHFPRTDPVVIMLTVDGDNCLLGRQTRFATGVYSTLAGFIEPGETIEAAVRRETLEEAGITAGKVSVIANQPWPFPASLMIGAIAEAESTEIIRDEEELEDCRWFTREEVIAMVERRHPQGLSIPPRMAIANHLIRAWLGRSD